MKEETVSLVTGYIFNKKQYTTFNKEQFIDYCLQFENFKKQTRIELGLLFKLYRRSPRNTINNMCHSTFEFTTVGKLKEEIAQNSIPNYWNIPYFMEFRGYFFDAPDDTQVIYDKEAIFNQSRKEVIMNLKSKTAIINVTAILELTQSEFIIIARSISPFNDKSDKELSILFKFYSELGYDVLTNNNDFVFTTVKEFLEIDLPFTFVKESSGSIYTSPDNEILIYDSNS